jgi:DNA polymerase-3 subunit gamma/tau
MTNNSSSNSDLIAAFDDKSLHSGSSYLALARKYRPNNFAELIGQEVLVTTLTNAINNQRLHHAYILTGIRGVGKTTTARIIAKSFNCIALENQADENQDEGKRSFKTQLACGICENCRLIAASKHQDVIEIDAASRTGVDDIREIIDSISYAPVMARHKIYIIDEVHMLSNSAFNALLKTLEEPPAHVKFIFATTEIRKVPVTILSRCQRFDLRRLDESEIANHLENILKKEGLKADKQALMLIAKFSEGSVRDSLSILDQALSINNYQEFLSLEVVEKMLLVNDKNKIIELFIALLNGDFSLAISKFEEFYAYSSDITCLIQDLMSINHKITSAKLILEYNLDEYSSWQKSKILELAKQISLLALTRIWQMLLKGLNEVNNSNSPKIVFEMLLARICYLSDIVDLKEILKNSADKISEDNSKKIAQNKVDEQKITHQPFTKEFSQETPKATEALDNANNEIVNEILRNFEGAEIFK